MDKFRIEVIAATENPQQVVWNAMHQDYSEGFVYDSIDRTPDEQKAGELIVKHLLAGNRGHYGCYDEQTEVLTSFGWVKWCNVKDWHNLAAIDIETQQIRFEVPTALQKYHHNGQIYRLEGQQLDTAVTLDHRMVVKRRRKDSSWTSAYFEPAADVLGKPRRYMKSGILDGSQRTQWDNPWGIDKKQFARLVGFFVGDGMKPRHANQIRFRLQKSRKIDFLHSLGIPVTQTAGDRYVIDLHEIGKWFLEKCYTPEEEKCLPEGYLTLSAEEIEGLLEGLKNSDGTQKENTWRYSSASIYLLDQLQALLHINNLSGNWSLAHQGNDKQKTGYYLHVSDRISPRVEINQSGRSFSYSEFVEPYNGFVYCATVSTGALIVRRNRKVMVSGNCLEHPQITFNVGYFPHSMMQQVRTHRVGMCLAGDVEISFTHPSLSEGESYYKSKLKDLAKLWHYGRKHQPTQADADYMKRQISARHIQVLDTNTNRLTSSHISNIYINGIKEVFQIETVTGEVIKATGEHRFWTNNGWREVSEFTEDTQLCHINYSGQKINPSLVEFDEIELANEEWQTIPNYPYYEVSSLGQIRSYMPRGGKNKPKNRLVQPRAKTLSQAKNYLFASFSDSPGGSSKRLNIHRLVLETFEPLADYSNLEARHINGNSYDNRLINLEWGTSKQNKKDNITNNTVASNRGEFVGIKSIKSAGFQQTYDIEVEHECHNFIGNGLVTHNSFDVQSFRYTGSRIVEVAEGKKDVEDVFYVRPVGNYTNRQGKRYFYSEEQRQEDLEWCIQACHHYKKRLDQGLAEEHARSLIPFDARQHFVVSCNLRSLLHLLDLRWKKDAQLEAQMFCELLFVHLEQWTPAVAQWYLENRAKKARLSP